MDNKLDVTAYGEMESNPYIINVSNDKSNWEPVASAATKEEGIEVANSYLDRYKFSEVVYMPEDDLDTNDVVWRSSEETEEEMYGFEAMSRTGLEDLTKALSSAIKTAGSVGVIQFLLNEDLGTDFEDQITFIKNTTDLSDSNKVLNEILQAAETLLDDVQIELLVQSLEGPEEMAEEGNPEEFEEEYQEPEDWSSVDSEPAGEEEIVEEPTDEGNAESGEAGLEGEEEIVEDEE